MADPTPLTLPQIIARARSGVAKVDLMGPRGTTLCSMEEIEAMAAVIVLSCVLPPPRQEDRGLLLAPVQVPVQHPLQTRSE